MTKAACQLYLISPPDLGDNFADRLTKALDAAPVAAFQLRMKEVSDEVILAMAEQLMPICAERDCAFVLNDRADLAARLGADGVHLGRSDGGIREARALLGKDVQIGATCHDSRHFAMEAGEAGADYVAFGAFYPSETKETTHRPDPEILSWWSNMFVLPCVAIGGITADNAVPLIEAGADFLAVCGAVWNHPEGEAAGVRAIVEKLRIGKKRRSK
jgi:thiamine-phosphate pyrophosphorylase